MTSTSSGANDVRPWVFAGVFLSVFILGLLVSLFVRGLPGGRSGVRVDRTASVRGIASAGVPAGDILPLVLPANASAERSTGDGWEYAGEIRINYVTAQEQLRNCLERQGWRLHDTIVLSESLHPRKLWTYGKGGTELIFMVWKQDVSRTEFAYRREVRKDIEKGIVE